VKAFENVNNESLYKRLSALSFALPQLGKDNCIAIVRIMVLLVFYSMGDLEIPVYITCGSYYGLH